MWRFDTTNASIKTKSSRIRFAVGVADADVIRRFRQPVVRNSTPRFDVLGGKPRKVQLVRFPPRCVIVHFHVPCGLVPFRHVMCQEFRWNSAALPPGVVQGVGGWVFCTTHRSVLAAQEFDAPLHDFGSAVSVLGSFRQSISSLADLRCRAGGPLPRRALSLLRRWIETCFVRVVNLIGASASNLVTFASNFRSGSLLSHFIINLLSLLFFLLSFLLSSSPFVSVLLVVHFLRCYLTLPHASKETQLN